MSMLGIAGFALMILIVALPLWVPLSGIIPA